MEKHGDATSLNMHNPVLFPSYLNTYCWISLLTVYRVTVYDMVSKKALGV